MPITLSELEDAFLLADFGPDGEVEVWIDRQSGKVYTRADGIEICIDDEDEPLPDDIDHNERYVAMPDKRELDLGASLPLAFARQFMEGDFEDVRDSFRQSGAYRRFRALVERRNVLDAWYAFEREATRAALKEWAQDNEIEISQATP